LQRPEGQRILPGAQRYIRGNGSETEEGRVRRKVSFLALGVAVAVAAVVAGYSGTARGAARAISPLPSSSCGPVVYKGSGTPDYIIPSDLPLQGAIRHQTLQISRAILWALADRGW
jgi:hypothetical protein